MDVLGGLKKLLTQDTKPEDEIIIDRKHTEQRGLFFLVCDVWISPISHF